MPTKEELQRATQRAKAKAESEALRMSALAQSPQQSRAAAAAMRATIPPELLSKRRAVGRSFDSPVQSSPQKPRQSIFASPKAMKETEIQKYKRERHEAYAAWLRSKAMLAEKMDRIWNQRHDWQTEDEPDHEAAAAAEIGPFTFREPARGVVPFLPGGPSMSPLGESRGRGYDEESGSDEEEDYRGMARFHSREYAGRGRLGFMTPLPGSTRGW